MRIKSSKKTLSRARMVLALDAAAREAVFARDGHLCVRCQIPGRMVQWSHVIGRRHKCVRWEPDNALTLCAGCHMFWHEYPTLSGEWFRKNWPERHERILKMYNAGGKMNVKALYEEMKADPPSTAVKYMNPIPPQGLPF